MPATTTAFDALVSVLTAEFEGEDVTNGGLIGGRAAGQRQMEFSVIGICGEMFDRDDADQFTDRIKGMMNGQGRVLFHEDDFDASNRGSHHTYFVGHVVDDPSACWAVRAGVFIPYDSDEDTSARFTVMEDGQRIGRAAQALEDEALARAAQKVSNAVASYAGRDNERLARLFDAVKDLKNGQWVDKLEAQFSRRGLEDLTPEAGAGKPGPRM